MNNAIPMEAWVGCVVGAVALVAVLLYYVFKHRGRLQLADLGAILFVSAVLLFVGGVFGLAIGANIHYGYLTEVVYLYAN